MDASVGLVTISLSFSNQQLKGQSPSSQSCEDRLRSENELGRRMTPKDLPSHSWDLWIRLWQERAEVAWQHEMRWSEWIPGNHGDFKWEGGGRKVKWKCYHVRKTGLDTVRFKDGRIHTAGCEADAKSWKKKKRFPARTFQKKKKKTKKNYLPNTLVWA